MSLIQRKQLGGLLASRVGAINYNYPAAATSDVTSNITTLLATAGDNGVSVPVQVSTGNTVQGLITVAPGNKILVRRNSDKKPIASIAGDEVYGRLTEAAGVYSLALFTEVAGVETSFVPASPTAIDYYPHYRFTMATLPTDALISTPVSITDDPTVVTTKQENNAELLTVTGLNTLSDLSFAPDDIQNVVLEVNGQNLDSIGGLHFTLSGLTITLLPAGIGYNIVPGDRVVARYTYDI